MAAVANPAGAASADIPFHNHRNGHNTFDNKDLLDAIKAADTPGDSPELELGALSRVWADIPAGMRRAVMNMLRPWLG